MYTKLQYMHVFTCKPKTSCSSVNLSSVPIHIFVIMSIANSLKYSLFGPPWSNASSPMNFTCTHTYSRIIYNMVKLHACLCMHMCAYEKTYVYVLHIHCNNVHNGHYLCVHMYKNYVLMYLLQHTHNQALIRAICTPVNPH